MNETRNNNNIQPQAVANHCGIALPGPPADISQVWFILPLRKISCGPNCASPGSPVPDRRGTGTSPPDRPPFWSLPKAFSPGVWLVPVSSLYPPLLRHSANPTSFPPQPAPSATTNASLAELTRPKTPGQSAHGEPLEASLNCSLPPALQAHLMSIPKSRFSRLRCVCVFVPVSVSVLVSSNFFPPLFSIKTTAAALAAPPSAFLTSALTVTASTLLTLGNPIA